MEPVIYELTSVKQLESGEYQVPLPNGKSPSGVTAEKKVIPAYEKEVIVTNEDGEEVTEIIQIPERVKWLNSNYGPSLQAHLDAGKDVEPYVKREPTYDEKRRDKYSPIGDQLDTIWKQFNQMRLEGTPLIQEADDELGKILAIKKEHPKDA